MYSIWVRPGMVSKRQEKYLKEINKCSHFFEKYEDCIEDKNNSFKKCHILYLKDFQNCIDKVFAKNEN
jgi:hypothetical protein